MSAVSDAWRLGVSLVSVATSPVMPDAARYVSEVSRAPAPARRIEGALALREVARGPLSPTTRTVSIVSSLVSFTDDHGAPFETDTFPLASRALLGDIACAADEATALDRVAQLALAMRHATCAFDALLACHAATRQLARGRDARAFGTAMSLEERLHAGRAIAAFPASLSRGGDPLGDTYHYWANVVAGVVAAHTDTLTSWAVTELFHAGPWLMRTVREGVFGGRLFAGDHAEIDRIGLAHGLALGAMAQGEITSPIEKSIARRLPLHPFACSRRAAAWTGGSAASARHAR